MTSESEQRRQPTTGDVVGWIQHGGPTWGRVEEFNDGRLLVERDGRTQELRAADVAVAVAAASASDVQRQAIRAAAEHDPANLWRALGAQFDKPFDVIRATRFLALADEAAPGLWVALWRAPAYFSRAGRTQFKVRRAAEVEAERRRIQKKQNEERVLGRLTQLAEQFAAGTLAITDVLAAEPEIAAVARTVIYAEPCTALSERGCNAVANQLSALHERDNPGWPLSHYLATALGDSDPWLHGAPALATHRRWLQSLRSEELPLAQTLPEVEPQTPLWAIDDTGTVERDDAIGWRAEGDVTILEVAIADLSPLYRSYPELLDHIAVVATSLYLPTGTLPLLSDDVGAQRHSLSADEAKPALLLRLRIAADGRPVADPELVRGRVRLRGVASYTAVDAEDSDVEDWSIAVDLAERMLAARQVEGGNNLKISDVSVAVRDGFPVELKRTRPWLGARKVVREAMIAANTGFGGILAAYRLAAPFRAMEKKASTMIARVDTRPAPHVGLGVEQYLFATSPIRRMSDVLAQWQLSSLFGEPPLTTKQMHRWISRSESAYQASKRWMNAAHRYWKLRYLEAHPDVALHVIAEPRAGDSEGRTRVRLMPLNLIDWVDGYLLDGETVAAYLDHVDAERNEFRVRI